MSEESDALLHIADDHPCCKPTLLWAHNRLLDLERENAELKIERYRYRVALQDIASSSTGWARERAKMQLRKEAQP